MLYVILEEMQDVLVFYLDAVCKPDIHLHSYSKSESM